MENLDRRKFVRLAGTAAVLAFSGLVDGCGNVAEQLMGSSATKPIGDREAMPASIGSKVYWVRNEAWYALRREWLYKADDPNGPGGDGTISNWNRLSKNADANANGLRFALGVYGGYVSDLIPGIGGDLSAAEESYWADRLSADAYGVGFEGSKAGHGCQCVAFASMVIYRATGGTSQLRWSWAAAKSGNYPLATQARQGDVVFKTSGTPHVAICVRNYGTGITVVESNYAGHEVIGRRDIPNSSIGSTWKVFTGRTW